MSNDFTFIKSLNSNVLILLKLILGTNIANSSTSIVVRRSSTMKLVTLLTVLMLSMFSAGNANAGLILGKNESGSIPDPFGSQDLPMDVSIYQSIYGSSLFAGEDDPLEIQTLRFFADTDNVNQQNELSTNTFNIFLSTLSTSSPRSIDLSQNRGIDEVLVFSGLLPSLSEAMGRIVLDIDLTQFFNYSALLGDLVLTVQSQGDNSHEISQNTAFFLQAEGDNFWNSVELVDRDTGSESQFTDERLGIVLGINEFESANVQVNEPSIVSILLLGLGAMLLRGRKKSVMN